MATYNCFSAKALCNDDKRGHSLKSTPGWCGTRNDDAIGYERALIRPVLIHVNGIEDSILDEGYFDKVIDFGQLLTNK